MAPGATDTGRGGQLSLGLCLLTSSTGRGWGGRAQTKAPGPGERPGCGCPSWSLPGLRPQHRNPLFLRACPGCSLHPPADAPAPGSAGRAPAWFGEARAAPGGLPLPLPRPVASGETLPGGNLPLPAASHTTAGRRGPTLSVGQSRRYCNREGKSFTVPSCWNRVKKEKKKKRKRCSKGARGNADTPGEHRPQ